MNALAQVSLIACQQKLQATASVWICLAAAGAEDAEGIGSAATGRYVFAGVFALLVLWLALIPASRIGQAGRAVPPWKNVRLWAIAVATIQMFIYLLW